uniref:Uncharacterized protein n=1 Tax=Anguilla anguilla TaxID=7936 RepID=A0A0E9Q9H5_ANGAN
MSFCPPVSSNFSISLLNYKCTVILWKLLDNRVMWWELERCSYNAVKSLSAKSSWFVQFLD